MRRERIPETPPSKWEQWLEEVLVRLGVGLITGVLFAMATPLLAEVALPGAWVAFGAVGFVAGVVGGDVVVPRTRRRRKQSRVGVEPGGSGLGRDRLY